MTRYAALAAAMVLTFLALFGLAIALDLTALTEDPAPLLDGLDGLAAAAAAVALLCVDVLLPVPSSLVMVFNGAQFGVLAGALLSLVGGVGAAALAFALGRRGGPLLARLVPAADRARVEPTLARYGAAAVALTRPLPMVAETVALLAGTTPLGWPPLLLAAIAGNLPPALVYALTGHLGATVGEGLWVFGGVMILTGAFFLAARRAGRP